MKHPQKILILFVLAISIILYLLFNIYHKSRADKTVSTAEYLSRIQLLAKQKRLAGNQTPVQIDSNTNNEVETGGFSLYLFILKLFSFK